ncbi:DUF2336 domain-containing protein [Stappia sp.]|uniref:DUF2336 domain-containing protein n=1 Tax=Stappia sp. TaxID=1870903 RepID=UPI003A996C7B
MLEALLKLARNPSPEARGRLLQRVADIFLDRVGRHTDAELELYCDIILKLLDNSGREERARLSRRIAPWSDTPNKVAYRLACDDITIAAPMLELSPSLNEADLLKLARRMPQSHLTSIAKRVGMPCRVSDTLVERGSPQVWRAVAGNVQSPLSDWALRTLAKRSLSDAPLRERMSERPDLTPLICEWLIPHVNAATRLRLEAVMAGTDPRDLTAPEEIRQDLQRRFSIFLETTDVDEIWRLVERGDYRFGSMILVLLAEGRINDAFQILGRKTETPLKTVQHAIFQAGIEDMIALALRAETTDQVFLGLAHLRCKHLRLPESQAVRWLSAYRQSRNADTNADGGASKNAPSPGTEPPDASLS